jgi:PTS system mannose-specific IIB component/fructoselysine and glucoselysine-specific PTS system IIB component
VSVLVRVDDRLVHGQVVVGWGRALKLRSIVLVDDAIAASAWEQDLYRMGIPPDMTIEFASLDAAPGRFAAWEADGDHVMILVGDVATLARLCAVVPVTRVNLGGIHQGPGRAQHLSYVFLSEEEAAQLRAIADGGVAITAQDVPTTRPVPLREVLR